MTATGRVEEDLVTLFRLVPSPCVVSDPHDGTILKVNDAFCRLFGYAREQVLGRTSRDLRMWDGEADRARLVAELADRGSVHDARVRVRTRTGDIRRALVSAERARYGGRDVIVTSLHDLTENANLLRALAASEARFRELFEHAPTGIVFADVDGTGRRINPAFAAMVGGTQEELERAGPDPITHPDDIDEHRRLAGELADGRRDHYRVEKRYRRPDGTDVWADVRVALVRDADGRPRQRISLIDDLTERRRAEAALRESEARYRAVVDSLREGVVVHSAAGDIVAWNSSAERILGLPANPPADDGALNARRPVVRDDGTPFPLAERPVMVALRTGRPHESTVMGVEQANGDVRWLSVSAVPLLPDGDGRPTGVVATFADVTDQRRREREREELIAELQAALATVRTLSGLLPICASCKKIRDESERWQPVEAYIQRHSDARFTHGVCPECAERYMDEFRREFGVDADRR